MAVLLEAPTPLATTSRWGHCFCLSSNASLNARDAVHGHTRAPTHPHTHSLPPCPPQEAVHINKSLTTLGRVIMELVEAQRSGRLGRHIPYRVRMCADFDGDVVGGCLGRHIPYCDSRLTFLLRVGWLRPTGLAAVVRPFDPEAWSNHLARCMP
eukprot:1161078-Pelagomonas_calceolata.AAC.15